MIHLWKTKEGNTINIADMDDTHLANSTAMLERRIDLFKKNLTSMNQTLAYMKAQRVYRLNNKKKEAKIVKQLAKTAIRTTTNGRHFRED